jgi:hypothetical protein
VKFEFRLGSDKTSSIQEKGIITLHLGYHMLSLRVIQFREEEVAVRRWMTGRDTTGYVGLIARKICKERKLCQQCGKDN